MIRPVSLAALALSAAALTGCGSKREQQAVPAPSPTSTATPAASPTPVIASDGNAIPKPAAIKTFGDWAVGCDNGWRCTMASLFPTDEAGAEGPTVTLIREPGATGRWSTTAGEGKPQRFVVDGRDVGSNAGSLAAAIANGKVLSVTGTAGTVSLKGAAAALRYIDAGQQRAGTTSATVAKGPATIVPAAPALPIVKTIALLPEKASLSPAQIKTMKTLGQCQDMENFDAPVLGRADAHTLVAALPCSAGAYNVIMALFVVRDGKVSSAQTDAPAGFDATGADSETPVRSLINADLSDGVLTSYAKGRGIGDCGVSQTFAWDGRRLRLIDQSEMPECRGNTDTISTWRARAIR